MKLFLALILVICEIYFIKCTFSYGSYKAAVVEYATESLYLPEDLLKYNAEEYVKFIQKAGTQGASIIVFPEDGLTAIDIAQKTHEQLNGYAIEVPNPVHKPNPCINESLDQVLRLLSCAASESGIYVVVNLIEKQKENGANIFFNTDVVIDRFGTIITRYRKINLFFEPNFKKGNEIVTFTTDFGVTFGLLICSDIFYRKPGLEVVKEKNVTDIILSSAWFSETPYLQALSVQAGYARATGVNLLAAGLSDPANKNSGSGIYLYDGKIAELYISPAKLSRLLIQEVPKIRVKLSAVKCNNNSQVMPRFRLGGNLNVGSISTSTENMTHHTLLPLSQDRLETKATLCNFNGVYCCKFHVVLEEALPRSGPKYMLALFYGVRQLGDKTIGVRSCGLIACLNKDKNSCGRHIEGSRSRTKFAKISIKGLFERSVENYDQPITLTYELTPVTEYTYCETLSSDKKKVEVDMIATQTLGNIMSFGIHGRMFEYDGLNPGLISGSSVKERFGVLYLQAVALVIALVHILA